MKRDVTNKLITWSQAPVRNPLVITGVRQCGKTYAMKDLGETTFGGDYAYFNFEKSASARDVFSYDLEPQRILDELSMLHGKPIVPGKTLLILDEIQSCIPAITSLKYFREELPELHVVCAGSLLGVTLDIDHERISFPVGKVDRMRMYPMSFKEFLYALNPGAAGLFERRYQTGASLDSSLLRPLEVALRMYYVIGGMPMAVEAWLSTKDLNKVEAIQDNILRDYENDFAKHAPKNEIPNLKLIWDSIPVQLAKENNKFVFSHVRADKRSKDLEAALGWLDAAGLVYKLNLVDNPVLPLSHKASAVDFKLYMSDVGLLRRKAGVPARAILQDDQGYREFKGSFTENFVMQELLSLGKTPYYWRSSNQAELDFLFEEDGRIVPVEVKADTNTQAKSYRIFCEKYHPQFGFKLSLRNVGDHDVGGTQTYSVPLYLAWKLEDWIDAEREKAGAFNIDSYTDEVALLDSVLSSAFDRFNEQKGSKEPSAKEAESELNHQ